MYQKLFPQDEEIPPPFDDHHINGRWERLLPQFLYEELTEELDPILAPLMTKFKERIPKIILKCKKQVCPQSEDADTTLSFAGINAENQLFVDTSATGVIERINDSLQSLESLYKNRLPSPTEECSTDPVRPNRIHPQSSNSSISSLNRQAHSSIPTAARDTPPFIRSSTLGTSSSLVKPMSNDAPGFGSGCLGSPGFQLSTAASENYNIFVPGDGSVAQSCRRSPFYLEDEEGWDSYFDVAPDFDFSQYLQDF
ncbi:hypothetical protein BU16DRAFT_596928 [Lophium mytilinum]|uniref:Uncharacterized protein n=1 Tax=Lophium mytilinum TaxID=390894 RepID=A0A6A6QDZ6_9PEZI|nr:hypothetical protein BU16DRAFT_596928 [Lophium mytilinum]